MGALVDPRCDLEGKLVMQSRGRSSNDWCYMCSDANQKRKLIILHKYVV